MYITREQLKQQPNSSSGKQVTNETEPLKNESDVKPDSQKAKSAPVV